MTSNNSPVYLISCCKLKSKNTGAARDVYQSPLFKKSLALSELMAKSSSGSITILSAKYGVVLPDEVIETYDLTLGNMTKQERDVWAKKSAEALLRIFGKRNYVFLAGKLYYTDIVKYLQAAGCDTEIMMKGLGIGQRLSFLDKKIKGEF